MKLVHRHQCHCPLLVLKSAERGAKRGDQCSEVVFRPICVKMCISTSFQCISVPRSARARNVRDFGVSRCKKMVRFSQKCVSKPIFPPAAGLACLVLPLRARPSKVLFVYRIYIAISIKKEPLHPGFARSASVSRARFYEIRAPPSVSLPAVSVKKRGARAKRSAQCSEVVFRSISMKISV